MGHRMNLERGFRRITWVVSLSLLGLGAFFVVPGWWSALDRWNRAGEPYPPGAPATHVLGFGLVEFPEGFNEAQVKKALDESAEKLERVRSRFREVELYNFYIQMAERDQLEDLTEWPRSPLPKAWTKWEALVDLDRKALVRISKPGTKDEAWPIAERLISKEVSHIYQPSSIVSGPTPSVLYSRKALLQAEAKGKLAPDVQAALSGLRKSQQFPSPIKTPFAEWAPLGLIAISVAAAPWGVFFVLRWILRGFRPD